VKQTDIRPPALRAARDTQAMGRATCYNQPSLKDPLLGPLAAIASGILVARFVPFQQTELLLVTGAFLLLGVVAVLRHARILAGTCLAQRPNLTLKAAR
jgi:hypothetical protein